MIEGVLIGIIVLITLIYVCMMISGSFSFKELLIASITAFLMVISVLLIGKLVFGVW